MPVEIYDYVKENEIRFEVSLDDLVIHGFDLLMMRFEKVIEQMIFNNENDMAVVIHPGIDKSTSQYSNDKTRWTKAGKTPFTNSKRQDKIIFLYNEDTRFWMSVFNHNMPDELKTFVKDNSNIFTHCIVFENIDDMSGQKIREAILKRNKSVKTKTLTDRVSKFKIIATKLSEIKKSGNLLDTIKKIFPDVFEEEEAQLKAEELEIIEPSTEDIVEV